MDIPAGFSISIELEGGYAVIILNGKNGLIINTDDIDEDIDVMFECCLNLVLKKAIEESLE